MLVRRETLRNITDVSHKGDITAVSQEGDNYGTLRMLVRRKT